MKKLKSILSIVLTGILIFSTVGFSVSRHYCMGMLVEESFYHIPQGCEMEGDDHCEDDAQHLTTDCCDDETLSIAGLEVQSLQKEKLTTSLPFVAAFTISSRFLLPQPKNRDIPTLKDPPRSIATTGRQILLLVQRFLI